MEELKYFFQNCDKADINKMIDIINEKGNTSLRSIELFINDDKNNYLIHNDYKEQLKILGRRHFDIYRRRDKFNFYYDDKNEFKYIYTTEVNLIFLDGSYQKIY